MTVIKKVRDKVDGKIARPAPISITTTSDAYARATDIEFDPFSSHGGGTHSWIKGITEFNRQDRRADIALYDEMDSNSSEINTALDIFADNITQVDGSKDSVVRGGGDIVEFVTDNDALRDLLLEVRDRLKINQRAWGYARDLVKNGEVFEEIVVREDLTVDRLKTLPTARMFRNEDDYGLLKPKSAYVQMDSQYLKPVAVFEDWEVLHTRLLRRNEDPYGTSILKGARRVYKQLQMMEDAMVMARLTRASSRLVYYVDMGNLPPVVAQEQLEKVKSMHRRRRLIGRDGQLRDDANPMTAEEDIFMAVQSNGKGRVEQLYGDLNISNIGDIEFFQNKLFGILKVPKSYAGVERDISNKSSLTMQDIQFARTIRRVQTAMRYAYNQLFDTAILLEGDRIEPDARYSITMPGMQTLDELREWEMLRIQGEVARIWTQELYLEPRAVYELLLGFTKEQAEKMYIGMESDFAKAEKNVNAAKAFRADQDNKFGAKVREALGDQLEALRELSEWKLEMIEADEAKNRG